MQRKLFGGMGGAGSRVRNFWDVVVGQAFAGSHACGHFAKRSDCKLWMTAKDRGKDKRRSFARALRISPAGSRCAHARIAAQLRMAT